MSFQAVVLAGGLGTRLHPLTSVVPKPMIPLAGKPIIQYIIDLLRGSGAKRIHIVARYLGEVIANYYSGSRDLVVHLVDSKDTADAVRLISEHLEDDNFLVTMGDALSNAKLDKLYEYHVSSNAISTIALKEVDNPLQYGSVYLGADNNIILFIEKPRTMELYMLSVAFYKYRGRASYCNLVNTGFYAFSPTVLELLRNNPGLMDFGRHVFPYLIENHYAMKGYILEPFTYWEDIGRIETYKRALWDLLEGKVTGVCPPGRMISYSIYVNSWADIYGKLIPPVYIGEGAVVGENAVVGPYVSLEKGARVERDAHVSRSIIWHRGTIGRGAQVQDSIIMNDVIVKDYVKVIDSIIGTGNVVAESLFNVVLPPRTMVNPYEG